jgi:hypothetical protein
MRIKGRKPSPAMVISIVALVFAVAGTSLAGVATISVLSKKEKKQTRNIAKDEINKAAPGLSVASATNAQNAANADALGGAAAGNFAAHINARWDTVAGSPADEPFGTFGALTLTGRCTDQGTDNPELRIRVQNTGDPEGFAQIAYTQTGGVATDSTSVSVGSSPTTLFVETEDEAEGAGVLVYNDSTQVTVVPFRSFTDGAVDASCEFAGQATTTTSP